MYHLHPYCSATAHRAAPTPSPSRHHIATASSRPTVMPCRTRVAPTLPRCTTSALATPRCRLCLVGTITLCAVVSIRRAPCLTNCVIAPCVVGPPWPCATPTKPHRCCTLCSHVATPSCSLAIMLPSRPTLTLTASSRVGYIFMFIISTYLLVVGNLMNIVYNL
jgi:hypothetical protein